MNVSADLIEKSLELVAERIGDPTPLVYRRLFEANPGMRELFMLDRDDSVKGQMLQQVLEAVMDFVGPRGFADGLFATEWLNHQGIGVPSEQFIQFFSILADTFRDGLGAEWTDEYDAAWRALVGEIRASIEQRNATT